MIHWVPKKTINNGKVNSLLQLSIETNKFTNYGPNVKLLEEKTRELLKIDNTKAVICVSNGTVALWAAVAGFEIYNNKNLQFYTQSFTFPASAQGYLNSVKIIDIDEEGGLDLELVDKNKCDGIIVTNVFGNLVNISKYEKWCKENDKFLIFDNAATSYSFYNNKNSCNYGNASTISFHHTKPIGFGEGGAIIIDSKYEKYVRNIINFGIDNYSIESTWDRRGANYKMSDIQAVYILQYMDNFYNIIEHHDMLYKYFISEIEKYNLNIKIFPNLSDSTPFISCLSIFMKNSNKIIEILLRNNIYSRKYYNPLTETPVSKKFYDTIICISCHIDMTKDDINRIIHIFRENFKFLE
jgi:dTDP-4-amino-4,6-dideoxygalactose transaminase